MPAERPDLINHSWTSQWIGLPGDPTPSPENLWLMFRRVFSIRSRPDRVLARIAGDTKYWLYVDGELVVFEGGLKRGPRPGASWYDTVDLTACLGEGDHTLALLLWHFGKDGFSHVSSGKGALLCELTVDGSPVPVIDTPWKVLRHPAYGSTGSPHPNFRLPESNLRYDARVDPGAWTAPGFDDAHWPAAVHLGPAGIDPWGELVERPIPLWRRSDWTPYERLERQELPDGQVLHIGVLPHNAQVTPCLEVEGPAGEIIDIRTDNYLGGSEPNVRAEYITKDGFQRHESPGWMNGHAVHYRVPRNLSVRNLAFRESGYDSSIVGGFACDDEELNTLWQKASRTLTVNLRDNFFDCPDRERAQWWGDVVLQIPQGFYAMDRRFDALARKAIDDLFNWRQPDGTLSSPVPGNFTDELPQQMLASVGHYGLWTYYLHSGDRDALSSTAEAVQAYLSLWKVDERGILEHRPGGWAWSDWGDNQDMRILESAWYILACRASARIARVLGDEDKARAHQAQADRLTETCRREFWDGAGFRSIEHTERPYDDRAQALACLAGMVRPSQYPAIARALQEQAWSSPYMEKYVLEALLKMGYIDQALERMKQRYAEMIASPITTLWEGWALNTARFGGGTYNHAWSGGPLELLSRCIAGVGPTEPGWKRFSVRPALGHLRQVDVVVPTEPDPIRLGLRKDQVGLEMKLTVPAGREAVVSHQTTTSRVCVNDRPDRSLSPETERTSTLPSGVWTIREFS
ncbi:alpha-L-rhamnosidase-related protein [Mucisphaera calidilacus]|uniref:Bacterial alpha-L-rhamnosidase n=1 Tax=Mucisphaera calidilacus TaxID=2527982 RepID=A0A518BX23_9BACT|nr:alpha-L-rhamnosidase C-terminal domain-containing protein [Mucisphaera calidilacus]QDU71528.1 Bacterial alpha-L-rhamnosidase [Mucisphaera calidilacus]